MSRVRWMERAVIVLAAWASIATSPKRWNFKGTVPEETSANASARVVEVEASSQPIMLGAGVQMRDVAQTWPGKATFFVAAGGKIEELYLEGRCTGSFCTTSKCEPPKDAFVRITSVKNVASWRLDASSAPTDVLLDPDKEMRTTISITATTTPKFRIEGDDGRIRDSFYGYGHDRLVFWRKPPIRTVVTFKAHVSLEGPCPTEAPCEPPKDVELAITKIVSEEIDAPK